RSCRRRDARRRDALSTPFSAPPPPTPRAKRRATEPPAVAREQSRSIRDRRREGLFSAPPRAVDGASFVPREIITPDGGLLRVVLTARTNVFACGATLRAR